MSLAPTHAFIDVPKNLSLDQRALFIGRLISIYRGTREPTPIRLGHECYSVCTCGECPDEMKQKLLDGIECKEKLVILYSEEPHVTPDLAEKVEKSGSVARA